MVRIGLVTGEFPPMQGGVGGFTRALAQGLAELGHEVHIYTSRHARPTPARQARDLRQPLPLDYGWLYPFGRRWTWRDMADIADWTLRHELQVVNVQYQAAAYHMRWPAVNWLPWRLRRLTSSIVTFHDLRPPYLFPKAGRWRRWVVFQLARLADGVIVTNPEDYATMTQAIVGPRLPPSRVAEIPIGSNIPVQPRLAEAVDGRRAALGLDEQAVLLGYFGFLNPSKGAEVLLAALRRLDDRYHLLFIGGQTGASDPDNNRAYLRQVERQIEAAGLGARVHWTGFLPEAEVSQALYAADLVVMPYQDGVSLRRGTLMATLAHGRPLLATAPAGQTGGLEHGHQLWLTPPGDADRLAEAIEYLAGRPALAQMLGEAGRVFAQRFTWDSIARRTSAFYARIGNE